MVKKVLLTIFLFLALPVFAEEQKNFTFMYLYAKSCGYCVKFNPIYQKLAQNYSSKCDFVKIDAMTKEGTSIANQLHATVLPFVVIIDKKANKAMQIHPRCLLDYACTSESIKSVVK